MSTLQTDEHHAFTKHYKFFMGNGRLTSFLVDNWIRDILLKTAFLGLFLLSSSKSFVVANMSNWIDGIWTWSLQWRRSLFQFE